MVHLVKVAALENRVGLLQRVDNLNEPSAQVVVEVLGEEIFERAPQNVSELGIVLAVRRDERFAEVGSEHA